MIKPFLYLFFLISFASSAQNLVPNGSFEEYSQCPEQNELGNGQFERCIGWYYSTPMNVGTPDYFNVCNNTIGGVNQGVVGVPGNFWGYQNAFEGNAYVGIDVFDYHINSDQFVGAEFIETRLLSPLKACNKYHFSMRVSLANGASHGIEKLGIVLTKDSTYENTLDEWLSLDPLWENEVPLTDTANWVLIEQDIFAKGGEKYLKIGYFADNEFMNEMVFNDSNTINVFGTYSPYYYIDSVCLVEIEEIESCFPVFPNVFSPNNDQINDFYSIEDIISENFVIMNRWGEVIITLSVDQPTWDGTFKGIPCVEGSYFYRTKIGTTSLTGFIELIR